MKYKLSSYPNSKNLLKGMGKPPRALEEFKPLWAVTQRYKSTCLKVLQKKY